MSRSMTIASIYLTVLLFELYNNFLIYHKSIVVKLNNFKIWINYSVDTHFNQAIEFSDPIHDIWVQMFVFDHWCHPHFLNGLKTKLICDVNIWGDVGTWYSQCKIFKMIEFRCVPHVRHSSQLNVVTRSKSSILCPWRSGDTRQRRVLIFHEALAAAPVVLTLKPCLCYL